MRELLLVFLFVSLTGAGISFLRGERKPSQLVQSVAVGNTVAAILLPVLYCVAALSLEGKLGMLKLFFPYVLPPALAWMLFSGLIFYCGKIFAADYVAKRRNSSLMEDLFGVTGARHYKHYAEYAYKSTEEACPEKVGNGIGDYEIDTLEWGASHIVASGIGADQEKEAEINCEPESRFIHMRSPVINGRI
jgi:hypothetical protein